MVHVAYMAEIKNLLWRLSRIWEDNIKMTHMPGVKIWNGLVNSLSDVTLWFRLDR